MVSFPSRVPQGAVVPARHASRKLFDYLSANEQQCLMRCSVVQKFDESLFNKHLTNQTNSRVELKDLVERGWVEPTGGRGKRYRVSGMLRDDAWRAWGLDKADPAAALARLTALCNRVAAYCAGHGWHVERLRQLAIAAPETAWSEFEKRFKDADRDFDLAYCQDLIDALSEPSRTVFLRDEFRKQLRGRQRRTITRAIRENDYYQTRDARYQPRREAEAEFRRLLAPDNPAWLLQLHGGGGIGKTTLLRRFASWECVKEDVAEPVIPCAVINCDEFDPVLILSQPWLLLLEAAEQLSNQLPESPFGELSRLYQQFHSALRRGSLWQSATSMGMEPGFPDLSELAKVAADVEGNFRRTAPRNEMPFVIILDGLDQVTLEGRGAPEQLSALVELLRRIHDGDREVSGVCGLRVVLAGRDALHKQVQALNDVPWARNVEVHNFSRAETTEYLRDHRGEGDIERIAAVFDRSDGIPMIVALYADWLSGEPEVTTEQIRDYAAPVVYFLIGRILERFNMPVVRDALLYSITVPPQARLDFEFFSSVMLPVWHRDKGRDDLPDPDDEAGQRQLWEEVLREAENTTVRWISTSGAGDDKAVTIRGDIRSELVAEVRDRPMFAELHQQAAEYYQAKADASVAGHEPGPEWPSLVARVLYHHVQHGDQDSIRYWRDATARCRTLGKLNWAQNLATAVTRQRDYRSSAALGQDGEENFPNLTGGGRGLPDQQILVPLLYAAYVQLAWLAALHNGTLPATSGIQLAPGQSEATALKNAITIRENAEGIEIRIADHEVIMAALAAVENDDAPRALAGLRNHPVSPGPASGDAWLVRARANAASYAEDAPSTLQVVLDAYQQAYTQYDDAAQRCYVSLHAASWLLRIDRPDLALAWTDRVADPWSTSYPEGFPAEVRARALLALGRPGSALGALADPPGLSGLPWRARTLSSEARLMLGQPRLALQDLADGAGADNPTPSMLFEFDLMKARVYGALLDGERAMMCVSQAEGRLLALGKADQDERARINTLQALLELRTTGNIHQAKVYLSDDFTQTVHPGGLTWTERQLARVELADRQGRVELIEEILTQVRKQLAAVIAPASLSVRAALAGVNARSLPTRRRREYLTRLSDGLARVAPPARMAMLSGLMYALPVTLGEDEQDDPALAEQWDRLAERFRAFATEGDEVSQLPGDSRDPDLMTDRGWRDLVLSQVFRLTGDPVAAGERRAEAMQCLTDPFLRWETLAARPEPLVTAPIVAPETIPPTPPEFKEAYEEYPVLYAAYLGEWGRRAHQPHDPSEILRWLRRAAAYPDNRAGSRQTGWHARLHEVIAQVESGSYGRVEEHESYERANGIWTSLGIIEQQPQVAAPPRPTGQPAVAVVLRDAGTTQAPGVVQVSQYRTADGMDLTARRIGEFERPDFDVNSLAGRWGDQAGERLSAIVLDARDTEVQVQARNPALAALPWELAVVGGSPLATNEAVHGVFRTASDALLASHLTDLQQCARREAGFTPSADPPSPAEWERIRAILQERANRDLRIRIVQPMRGGSLDSERRFSERRLDLQRVYQRAFRHHRRHLDLDTIYGDEILNLYAPTDQPDWADAVHVLTVMEATDEMPVLNLGTRNGPPITATQLDLLLQRLKGAVPPLVILDVVAPPSPVETRRHLLLRNRFAQQLLALGNVSTIIAARLADRYATDQWQDIADGFAKNNNAAEICRTIQLRRYRANRYESTGDEADAHAVAFQATALFTNIHPGWLLQPGLLPGPAGT